MYKWWVELDTSDYGWMFADTKPLWGDKVTIRVQDPDGTVRKVTGYVIRIE